MVQIRNLIIPLGVLSSHLRPVFLLIVNTPLYTRLHVDYCYENMSARTKKIIHHFSKHYVLYSVVVMLSYWFWQGRPEVHVETNLLAKFFAIIYQADIYQTYLMGQYANRPLHGIMVGTFWQGLEELHPLGFIQAFLDHCYALYHPAKTTIMKKILLSMYFVFAGAVMTK